VFRLGTACQTILDRTVICQLGDLVISTSLVTSQSGWQARSGLPPDRLVPMLLFADGTTTSLVEASIGETLKAEVNTQRDASPFEAAAWPGTAPAGRLIVRYTRLVGAKSGLVRLYARSLMDLDALPEAVRSEILSENRPIGRILQGHQVENCREIIETGYGIPPAQVCGFQELKFPWRTLAIRIAGKPAILVTEWFCVGDFLDTGEFDG
jgi:chorismate-pyruvate lyase